MPQWHLWKLVWKLVPEEKQQRLRRRQFLLQRSHCAAQAAATRVKFIAPEGVHHTVSPRRFSVKEYAINLCHVGYIVVVHLSVPVGLDPPEAEGYLITTWRGLHYHLKPGNDRGFIQGSFEYLVVVLNNMPVMSCLLEQVQ